MSAWRPIVIARSQTCKKACMRLPPICRPSLMMSIMPSKPSPRTHVTAWREGTQRIDAPDHKTSLETVPYTKEQVRRFLAWA